MESVSIYHQMRMAPFATKYNASTYIYVKPWRANQGIFSGGSMGEAGQWRNSVGQKIPVVSDLHLLYDGKGFLLADLAWSHG